MIGISSNRSFWENEKKRESRKALSFLFPEIKNGDASIAGSRSKLADARFARRPHFRNLQEQVSPVYNAFLISWKSVPGT